MQKHYSTFFNKQPVLWISLFISFCLLFTSCSGNKKPENATAGSAVNEPPPISFEKKVPLIQLKVDSLYSTVACPADPTLHFALYIPKSYTIGHANKLLILFDPHGDGIFPINKYKKTADKWGFILMASNDSKNGNDKALTARITANMMDAALAYFPADSMRFFCGGFSGGARVASLLALSGFPFEGLMIAGAGFPSEYRRPGKPAVICALAGNGDMNRRELLDLRNKLNNDNSFQLIRFEGKHEWPSADRFEEVLATFDCALFKDGLIQESEKEADLFSSFLNKREKELIKNKDLLALADFYRNWTFNMKGTSIEAALLNKSKSVDSSPEYNKALDREKKLTEQENAMCQQLLSNFGTKDQTWWMKTMNDLIIQQKKSDALTAGMYERVKGSMSLMCYMNLNKAMQSTDTNTIKYLADLYTIIDPSNSESWYLLAVADMKTNNQEAALAHIKKAIETGLKDKARIQQEAQFVSLLQNSDFNKLINSIQ